MNINSLQAQSAIWLFTISLSSVFLFSVISSTLFSLDTDLHSFNIKNLPSTIVIFSIVSVLVSNMISSILSKPFLEIRKIVEMFNKGDYKGGEIKLQKSVTELEELELFLLNSLKLKSEKFYIEQEFAKEARQVAHDIKAPLSALGLISRNVNLNNKRHKILVNSITHLKQISSNLLNKYIVHKSNADAIKISKLVSIFPLLNMVVQEYNIIVDKKKVSIVINASEEDKNVQVNINPILFKRIISNLINNSVEAVKDVGEIAISLKRISNFIRIEIKDNGCGISSDVLPHVFKEGFTYGKKQGTGLGLNFVASCVESWGGNCDIQSIESEGTTIGLILPETKILKPREIVLLDDLQTVTMSWELEAEKRGYAIKTFNEVDNFMDYVKKCNKETEIHVDSDLNTNVSGEMLLKELYQLGFKNLFLETGNDLMLYRDLPWIKGVIGKEPPFSKEL